MWGLWKETNFGKQGEEIEEVIRLGAYLVLSGEFVGKGEHISRGTGDGGLRR